MYKIYNHQSITIHEKSNDVEITEDDIKEISNWEYMPYEGGNNYNKLLKYIAGFIEHTLHESLDLEEVKCPKILIECYKELCEEPTRTEVWNSLSKSGDSTLFIADKRDDEIRGSTLASTPFYM